MKLKIEVLRHNTTAFDGTLVDLMPRKATPGASGFDLRAAVDMDIYPGDRAIVPAGFRMEIPVGYEAQVRARSGLALRHGITMANGIGTIDSDYRGEVGVIVINLSHDVFEVKKGDRIAQMVIMQLPDVEVEEVQSLSATERGAGGFGSTGVK